MTMGGQHKNPVDSPARLAKAEKMKSSFYSLQKHPTAYLHAAGLSVSISGTLLINLSTTADMKVGIPS